MSRRTCAFAARRHRNCCFSSFPLFSLAVTLTPPRSITRRDRRWRENWQLLLRNCRSISLRDSMADNNRQNLVPPPPPGTPHNPSAAFYVQQQHPRRRADGTFVPQPPSLMTAPLGTQGAPPSQSQLPFSGTFSPRTPGSCMPRTPVSQDYASVPSTQFNTPTTPAMAQQPYNPRQWSQRSHGSMSQMMFQARENGGPATTRDASGMEGRSVLARSLLI